MYGLCGKGSRFWNSIVVPGDTTRVTGLVRPPANFRANVTLLPSCADSANAATQISFGAWGYRLRNSARTVGEGSRHV